MFAELRLLLQTPGARKDDIVGKTLDCLKKIEHFRTIDSNLGSQYLVCLLPCLRPFILRQGFTLLNESDQYVLVEGDLRVQDTRFGGNKPWDLGRLIDLRDHPHKSFAAWNDCNMIRIVKGPGIHSIQQKKIIEIERERSRKSKEYQKAFELPENKQKLEIVRENPFFSILGSYDAAELAIGSHLKEYSQAASTHETGDQVDRIGYLVSGKVKLTFEKGNKNRREAGITWFLNQKDWVGLQEFLWDEAFESSGEISSIGAIILWIPCELFSGKFGIKTNYQAINRLIGLTKTKKVLFQRSLNCRRKKQEEIDQYNSSTAQLSSQLKAKMSALQVSEPKRKAHISRVRLQAEKKIDIQVPDFMMHKMKNLQEEPILLPRIKDKTSFFPDQYANVPVSTAHKKEMARLEYAMGKKTNAESSSTIEHSPETLYKTIYDKISYRFGQRTARSSPREPATQGRSPLHFNQSIYNNFKVARKEAESLKKNKTLTILANPEC